MKILIVGGGTGGTIIANNLARRLSKEILDEKVGITLLSASDRHMYQPGLLYVAFGQMTPDELYRDEASLLQASIEFHVDPVKKFNTDDNHVITESGKRYDYDYLVIATGSRIVPEQVPGLKEGADTFYTEESALKLFHKLRDFEGGDISIVVGVPHKCPIAPVEFTFSLHEYLLSRGIRDKTNIKYHYPIGRMHTIENVAKWAKPQFDDMDIEIETLFNVEEVDIENKVVRSIEGTESKFDILVSIPPHSGMEEIEENGLGDDGWIPTNRNTLMMEGSSNVWIVGDTASLPISKTGSVAHFEAEVISENIASIIKIGVPVKEYDGKVYCFIETGHDSATYASFNYKDAPVLKPQSKAMHALKMSYNQMYWTSVRGLI